VRALDQLAAIADRVKALGLIAPPGVDGVLARILPVNKGPVILVEPSDNVGGGAPGDGTGIRGRRGL
jgi:microcystin degradation protein MlrC